MTPTAGARGQAPRGRWFALVAVAIGCHTAPVPRMAPDDALLARLGYPPTARLLILHADDMAMTAGVTHVTLSALRGGIVNSASMLAPPSFVDSVPTLLRAGERLDIGVHLTLTSESARLRWPPSAGTRHVPSLVDTLGTLPLRARLDADVAEIERELAAQIARLRRAGVEPTHLDSHQGVLYTSGAAVFDAWRRVAKRECLPIPIPRTMLTSRPYLARALDDGHIAINDMRGISPDVAPAAWDAYYRDVLRELRPGITMLIVHLGEDTPAERESFAAHSGGWGADWRARDLRAISDAQFRRLAQAEGVHLVTWRDVGRVTTLCRGNGA